MAEAKVSELRAYLESDNPRDSEIDVEFRSCLEALPDAGHDSLSLAEGWVWFRAGWLLRDSQVERLASSLASLTDEERAEVAERSGYYIHKMGEPI